MSTLSPEEYRQNFLEKWSSPCEHDAKNKHYWERRGVIIIERAGNIFVVWQCSQCEKGILQFIEPLTLPVKQTDSQDKKLNIHSGENFIET